MGNTYYFPTQHTAEEWRQQAAASSRRSQESFERCDTDGYLSQWASDQTSRMYHHLAKLAETDGVAEMPWLFTPEGDMVDEWRWVQGQYGSTCRVRHQGQTYWFNPSEAKKGERRLRTDLKKGFVWGTISAPVVSRFGGTSVCLNIVDEVQHDAERTVVHTVSPDTYADHTDRTEADSYEAYQLRRLELAAAARDMIARALA